MRKIIYIGTKEQKFDNVAQTGFTWTRGQVIEVADDKKAAKLLEHPRVWADADQPYEMQAVLAVLTPEPKPGIRILPQGGDNMPPNWEPIVVTVTADAFMKLHSKEWITVFMTPEDADLFKLWKDEPKPKKRAAG